MDSVILINRSEWDSLLDRLAALETALANRPSTPATPKIHWTVREAAVAAKVRNMTVRAAMAAGQLPYKLSPKGRGGRPTALLLPSDVEAWSRHRVLETGAPKRKRATRAEIAAQAGMAAAPGTRTQSAA